MLIGMKGHEARAAYDGASGLAIARDLCRIWCSSTLRCRMSTASRAPRAAHAPEPRSHDDCVAMTGFGQNQDRERTRSEGFDAHLVKPVDMALFDDLLAQAEARRGNGGAD